MANDTSITKLPVGQLQLVAQTTKDGEKRDKPNSTSRRLPIDEMEQMLKSNAKRAMYNRQILETQPDMQRNIELIGSQILAPNELKRSNLTYKSVNILPTGLNNSLNEIATDFGEEQYQLTDKLETIVKEAMFTHGAYALATIPINNITFLQSRAEDKDAGLEVLSNTSKVSTLSGDFNYSEETNLLAIGSTQISVEDAGTERVKSAEVQAKINATKEIDEAFRKLYLLEVNDDVKYKYDAKLSALSKKIPIDSIVPIYKPSTPEQHEGYIVILDQNSNPLSLNGKTFNSNSFRTTASLFKQLDKEDGIDTSRVKTIDSMDKLYETVVTNHFTTLLKSKKVDEVTDFDINNDMKDVLFTRALKNQETRLLFIPKQNMMYIAFDIRENGTGVGILEKIRVLASMRTSLMIARYQVNMKNSITDTVVDITVDEDEIDVDGFIAETKAAVISHGRNKSQWGMFDPNDITEYLRSAGYVWKIKGPGIPEYDVSVSEESRSYVEPEGRMEDDLKRLQNLAFGLPVRVAEEGMSDTLATAILENKELMVKYIYSKQKVINNGLSKHMQSLLNNSHYIVQTFTEKIKEVLKSVKPRLNLGDVDDDEIITYVIKTYIDGLKVYLPTAETSEEDGSKEMFTNRKDFIEEAVELYFSSEALPSELIGDMGDKIEDLKIAITHTLMRNWMKENGYIPELTNIISTGDDGKKHMPLLEEFYNYQKDMSEPVMKLLKDIEKVKRKTDKKLDKIGNSADEPEPMVEPSEDGEVKEEKKRDYKSRS